MDIEYLAVTRDTTILAQCAAEDGDFDVLVNEILQMPDLTNPKIQIDKQGHRFYILHNEKGLNVITSCSPETESGDAFGVLEHVYRSFLVSFSSEWLTASAFSLQREFEPQLRQTIESHSSHFSNSLSLKEDSSSIVMTALENSILNGDSITTQLDPSPSKTSTQSRRSNIKLKMFIIKYKWIFLAIAILFIILIILVILLVTTE